MGIVFYVFQRYLLPEWNRPTVLYMKKNPHGNVNFYNSTRLHSRFSPLSNFFPFFLRMMEADRLRKKDWRLPIDGWQYSEKR
jgi:hypothetical protein